MRLEASVESDGAISAKWNCKGGAQGAQGAYWGAARTGNLIRALTCHGRNSNHPAYKIPGSGGPDCVCVYILPEVVMVLCE